MAAPQLEAAAAQMEAAAPQMEATAPQMETSKEGPLAAPAIKWAAKGQTIF